MIKALVFDYFGVISSDSYWKFVKADKNISSDFSKFAQQVNLGQLHWRDFLKTVSTRLGVTVAEVEQIYQDERLNPEVVAFINELKDDNYKIALLSNAHHEFLEPIIKRTHLDSLFDVMILSSRVNLIKPDQDIYKLVLNKLDVAPKEAIMIDDTKRHVEAARIIGMEVVLFNNSKQARSNVLKIIRNHDND